MKVIVHEKNGQQAAEAILKSAISSEEEALDMMSSPSLNGIRKIILRKEFFHPDFFKLASGLAGAILQKFVNYRMTLAIVGDFENIKSDNFKAFVLESNRGNSIFFVKDVEAALDRLLN